MTVSVALLIASAFGQSAGDFTTIQGPLLAPSGLSWGDQTTIGSPAVLQRAVSTIFGTQHITVVFYETRIGPATTACPAGEWGIGVAWSLNNGGVVDFGEVVLPTADTYYSCVAAHPSVVSLGDDTWAVYFKAEQDTTGCDPNTRPWGCDRYSGVGRFSIQYTGGGGNLFLFDYSDPDGNPVLQQVAQDMGYPSVMYNDGQFRMAFAQNPDIYTMSSPFTGFPAAAPPQLAIASGSGSGVPSWNEDELHSPSIYCDTAGSGRIAVGGRDFASFPTLAEQSVGMYTSSDLATWSEGAWPYLQYSVDGYEVRHLDMTTSGSGAGHGLWFTAPDPADGVNKLFLARTAAFDRRDIDDKRCP